MGTADNDGKEDIWTGSTAVKGQGKRDPGGFRYDGACKRG